MREFEVLMISIDWASPDKFRTIIPAKKNLEPSKIAGEYYEYDIVLYTKEENQYYQFAIKTKHTPLLKNNEGQWSLNFKLYNIQDDLWIIKGDWRIGQRGKGYHHCPSINTIGKIEIGISEDQQNIQYFATIDINNNIDDFDFEQLKNDFEGDLWNLITSNKSTVYTEKIEFKYCDRIFRFPESKLIIDFLNEFDRISRNPKKELSSTKELRKTEKVIPIVETYRKLSTVGISNLLPSKGVIENYNLFENSYVCFMLHSIYYIISKNINYTSLQINRLNNEIDFLKEKIEKLQNPDPKVNPEIINEEIRAQEESLKEWKINWENNKINFVNNHNNTAKSFNELIFQISGVRYYEGKSTFWGKKLNGNDPGWSALEFETDPDDLFEEGKEITVKFYAAYKKHEITVGGNQRNKYSVWAIRDGSFEYVNSFQDKIIQRQRVNFTTLQNNNWSQFSILSSSDRNKFIQERNNQVQTLNKKIEKLKTQIKNINEFNEEQLKLKPLIEQRVRSEFFKKIHWKKIHGFKPSMSFIQNINYRNALRYYKEILLSEGIDIEIFDLYENLTAYSLREMPQVYELWCLITQIKTLEESFHFIHNANDLTSLLKKVDPNKQKIEEYAIINFHNRLAGRKVTLHYQKNIANNKRPDFIIEMESLGKKINLILDSKFKNYNYKKSIIYETIDMTNKYGGGENYVFILHPCKDGIFENRNIKYTNHGGERIFYAEEEQTQIKFPFHEYGYIELKPNNTDTLKKLIAMGFEYLLESDRNAKKENKTIDPKPENDMFCLNCGETNISIASQIRRNNVHYNCTCNNDACGHKIYIDYCWNCKTKLFKHGSYWDYHLESPWSIYDIRCPNCGMTVV